MTSSTFLPETFNAAFHFKNLPYRPLGKTGLNISTLSYGGSALAGFYGDCNFKEAEEAIVESLRSGINFLDTSPWYGESEEVFGRALAQVPRSTFYIATKAGRNFTPDWSGRFDFSSNGILKSFERSLKRLQVNYVDVIQLHDVEFCLEPEQIINEALPALESIVKAGKAKFIGITGYDLEVLKNICEQSTVAIDTILSYSNFNLHDTGLLNYILYFKEKKIGVINAAPLSMSLLTNKGPPEWHPSSEGTKKAARVAAELALQKGVKLENVALGYGLRPQNPYISTTLVSIPTKDILKENLAIMESVYDEELYNGVKKPFATGKHSWEGVEISEYKNFLKNKSL